MEDQMRLYRYNDLATVTKPAAIAKSTKKQLCVKFQELGLQITVTATTKKYYEKNI